MIEVTYDLKFLSNESRSGWVIIAKIKISGNDMQDVEKQKQQAEAWIRDNKSGGSWRLWSDGAP